MAWTTPRTWVTSELVTASIMNTHIQANLNYLYTQVASQFYLSAKGGTPSTTAGCDGAVQTETSTNKVNLYACAFDGAGTDKEYIEWEHDLPADYDGGTVTYKVKWWCNDASTNAAVYGLQAFGIADGDPIDTAWGGAIEVTDSNNADGDLNISPASGAVTIAGSPVAGETVHWRFYRDPNNGSDTLAPDGLFIRVTVNYTRT